MNYVLNALEKERNVIIYIYSNDLISLMNVGMAMGKSDYHDDSTIEIRGHSKEAGKLIWWYPKD